MDKEEIALEIVTKILPKHLSFTVYYTEQTEEGSFNKELTERSQKIFDEILNLLEKHESNTSK